MYIAPKIREYSLGNLMDYTQGLPAATVDGTANAKRVGWDSWEDWDNDRNDDRYDDKYKSFPDSNYYNLWKDVGWSKH